MLLATMENNMQRTDVISLKDLLIKKNVTNQQKMCKRRGKAWAPRFMGLATAIKESANTLGLKSDLTIDNGFFIQTVIFEVEGPEERINLFCKWVEESLTN